MKIARVFPRKTNATPVDELSFVGLPPLLAMPEVDEVHISVTFTFDKSEAVRFAYQWEALRIPVKVDGPAYDNFPGEFTPGMYVKPGYVITSRGCNGHCWFCKVPCREGPIRELEIKSGSNVLDNNLLQCSESHIKAVFEMLKAQKERPIFTGGLEAKLLKSWHAEALKEIKTKRMYFAYDTPDDYEPLVEAGEILYKAGFIPTQHHNDVFAYVLIGYKNDTFDKAEKRLLDTLKAGFMPYAMLWMDDEGKVNEDWKPFQRLWIRPAIIASRNKGLIGKLMEEKA